MTSLPAVAVDDVATAVATDDDVGPLRSFQQRRPGLPRSVKRRTRRRLTVAQCANAAHRDAHHQTGSADDAGGDHDRQRPRARRTTSPSHRHHPGGSPATRSSVPWSPAATPVSSGKFSGRPSPAPGASSTSLQIRAHLLQFHRPGHRPADDQSGGGGRRNRPARRRYRHGRSREWRRKRPDRACQSPRSPSDRGRRHHRGPPDLDPCRPRHGGVDRRHHPRTVLQRGLRDGPRAFDKNIGTRVGFGIEQRGARRDSGRTQ